MTCGCFMSENFQYIKIEIVIINPKVIATYFIKETIFATENKNVNEFYHITKFQK